MIVDRETALAFVVGVSLASVLHAVYVHRLILRYIRQGWLRFPPLPTNYRQRCIDNLVWKRTNPWMIYGSKPRGKKSQKKGDGEAA